MRLVVDISDHGYGHLAQTSVVLAALRSMVPDLEVVARTSAPQAALHAFLGDDVVAAPPPEDAVPVAAGPDRIDRARSAARLAALIERLDSHVEADKRALAALQPDALLSNVGPVGIAAARRLGVPACALCSLNWADILAAYVGPGSARALDRLRDCYRDAARFIQPEPALPMAFLGARRRPVGPLVRRGTRDPAGFRRQLGLVDDSVRIGLASWGGIASGDDFHWLPARAGLVWLVSAAPRRADMRDYRMLGVAFRDIVANADLVIAKPGYGMFVEAAAAGTPVIHPARPDWPETAILAGWLARHVPVFTAPREGFADALPARLDAALAAPRGEGTIGDGSAEAATTLLEIGAAGCAGCR